MMALKNLNYNVVLGFPVSSHFGASWKADSYKL